VTVSNASFTGRNDGTADAYEGGAIHVYDATDVVTISDSSFDSYKTNNIGGAIRSYGATIDKSTFSNNTVAGGANDGGAICNTGTLSLTNSTFSANSVTDLGGGIFQSGNATIKNSTFYNNTAGTGEAIYTNSGTVTVANTIVAKSTASSSLCFNVTSNDYNVQYNGTCFTAQGNDQSGDPLLNALADNGGPTKTHALNDGSSAIDNALGSVCTDADVNSVDQRGEARTATCDIGSYEYTAAVSAITVCSSGCDFTTINGAIDDAGTTDGDTIEVYDGTYSENINFDGKNITIQSQNGVASTTIQGSTTYNTNPVVNFSNGETSSAVLDGFTIDNYQTTATSRGIYISGATPTIKNSIIENNTANNCGAVGLCGGGAVYITGSVPIFDNVDMQNNTADNREGGAIYITGTGGGANISNGSTISGNTTGTNQGYGGGIHHVGTGTLTITDSTVESNHCQRSGGGIYLSSATAVITGSTIKSNDAAGNDGGGGIHIVGTSVLTLSKSHVLGNRAYGTNNLSDGGGIKIVAGTATITNSVIAGNTADGAWWAEGGGIYNTGTLNLYFSTIADNYVDAQSGGLHAGGTETVVNSIIWGNSGGSEISGTIETLYLTETSSDPLFETRDTATDGNPTIGGNYDLQSSSNCIDTGDETNAPSDDIEDNTRPTDIGGKGDGSNDYDKGAYEYVP
jgi:hypothetical protein